uniref:WSN domain-containing protein n=1 Tax=Caenorhabditis japonica TaxID=281687 RepID=A0A8R1E183_CAEJA
MTSYRRVNNELDPAKILEKKTATVTRLMNAINLQNELLNGRISIQDVVAEALGLQADPRYYAVIKPNVHDTVAPVKLTYLLSRETSETPDELVERMSQLEMPNSSPMTSAEITELFKFSSIGIGEILDNKDDYTKYDHIFDEEKWKNLNKSFAIQVYDEFASLAPTIPRIFNVTRSVHKPFADLAKSFNQSSLFNLKWAEFFKQFKSIALPALNEIFGRLEPSFKLFGLWLNSTDNQDIMKQLEAVKNLFSYNDTNFHGQALMGLPNGLRDLETLSQEFEDEWLKSMLNNGGSLHKLRNALLPLLNFATKFRSLEEQSIRRGRSLHYKTVHQALNIIRNIVSHDTRTAFSDFSKVKTDFLKYQMSAFDDSVLIELNGLLSSKFLSEFHDKASGAFNETYYTSFFEMRVNLSDTAKYIAVLESFKFFKDFGYIIKLLPGYIRTLENVTRNQQQFTDILPNVLRINKVYEISALFESNINAAERFIKVLKMFSPARVLERTTAVNLDRVLKFSMKKLNMSRRIENTFKKEIRASSNRLKTSLITRQLTHQLASSQRALSFYLNPDFLKIVLTFVSTGESLNEQIGRLSAHGKQVDGSGWDAIKSFKPLSRDFVSDVRSMLLNVSAPGNNLMSLGKSLSALDKIKVPKLNFSVMASTLFKLESSSIGQFINVSNAEKSLEQVYELRFAAKRKTGSLQSLLSDAKAFFKDFFKDEPPSNSWLLYILIGLALVIVVAVAVTVAFVLNKRRKQDGKKKKKKVYVKPRISDSKSKSSKSLQRIPGKSPQKEMLGKDKEKKVK